MNGKSRTRTNKYSKKSNKRSTKKNTYKVPKAIKTYVKKETAKNIENKLSSTVGNTQSVLTVQYASGVPTFNYYLFSPSQSGLFSMQQGVGQDQRIGNIIKLKRWVVKGSVYFDPNFSAGIQGTSAFSQGQGYVDVYFGRPTNMSNTIQPQLPGLYQDGAQTITPECNLVERLYSINRDQYKVYWHKRFKIGTSGNTLGLGTGSTLNNDYKLNHEFGFDVCKLCTKNKILKYDDNTTDPSDALVDSLYLWATFTMPGVDYNYQNVGQSNQTVYSPPKIACQTYIEYEDA